MLGPIHSHPGPHAARGPWVGHPVSFLELFPDSYHMPVLWLSTCFFSTLFTIFLIFFLSVHYGHFQEILYIWFFPLKEHILMSLRQFFLNSSKFQTLCPDQCGSVGWMSSHKGLWFDSRWGHKPGLWVWPSVRVHVRGNQLMFLSHIYVSHPFFLAPFPSL